MFKDADGVEVQTRGLGGTESVECLAPSVCLSLSSSSGSGKYSSTSLLERGTERERASVQLHMIGDYLLVRVQDCTNICVW